MKKYLLVFVFLSILISNKILSQSMNCATATQLSLVNGTACVNGTNVGAISNNILFGGCNIVPVNMVWYTYVSNGSNNSFTVAPGTMTNPMIVIYLGGCPGTGTLQNCVTAVGNNTIVTGWGAAPGTQVWIGIASTSVNNGTFIFCVSSQPTTPGAGNTCSTAIPVCSTVFTQSTVPSNNSGQTPNCFVSPAQQDIWMKFTIKQAGTLAWTATPLNLATEFDWCLWDITGGCPGVVACCNYNYAGGSSLGFGMQAQAGNVACGYNLATNIPQREFCPPMVVTCGRIYALQIDNYNFNNTGFNLSFVNSTALIKSDAIFAVTPTLVCGPSLVASITNSSTGTCGGQTWNFGDGTPLYNGVTPPAHSYTNPGTYAITASIPGVCPSATTQFVQLLAPLAATVTPGPIACFGLCTGTAGISAVTGGNGIYTYSWSNGSTSNSVTGLCAGIYSVTIFNAVCATSITKTVSIVAPPALSITATPFGATCGNNNGSLTVSASGGTPTYSFSFNGGPFTAITNYTALVAGSYTMTARDSQSCQVSVVVTITQTPAPIVSVNSVTVCPGIAAVLTASGGTTYSWTPAAGLNTTTGTSVIATVSVTTSYTVIGTIAGCTGTSVAVVNIFPLPTPTATSNSPICIGKPINFTGSGGVTYTWTGPGGFNSNAQNPIIAIAQNSNAGTYTLTITNANGCINSTTTNVIINPLPVPIVNNPLVCLGQNILLTAMGGTSYAWAGPLGFISAVQNPTITNALLNMSGGYTVTVTSASGCTANAVANVTVITLPQPTIISSSPNCVGSTLSFTGAGGVTYTWSGPNGFASLLQNPSIPNVQIAASGVYTLMVSAGTCTNLITANVIINPLPTPTATSNSPVCVGQPINFTGNGGVTYTWTGPGGFNSNSQNPVIAIAQNSNAGTYTLAVTNANSCINTTTTNVIINPLPVPIVNNPLVCLGQNILLTALGGTSYAWAGPLGFISALQNPTLTNAQLNMSGGYTVTVTSAFGCTANSIANVTVIALPQPTITSTSPNCFGSTLSFTGTGGVTYTWSGPNGFASLLQNPSIPNVQMAASGVYTLIISAGTCTNVVTANVIINPLPTPTATSNSPVCIGQPINFTGNGGVTYTWTGPGGFNSNSQNPVIAIAQNSNAGTYTLTVTNINSCINFVTTNVVINQLPLITVNNPTACVNSNLFFTSNALAGYSWSGPLGFLSLAQNPVIPNAIIPMTGQYTLVGTSALGCTNTAFSNALVSPSPTATINSNNPVCVGGSLNLNGSGGTSYLWSGPNGFNSINPNNTINNISFSGAGVYSLIVTANTCSSSTSLLVVVNPLPTPIIQSNSPVCFNSPITFTAGGGVLFSWNGPAGFTTTGPNPVILNSNNGHAGIYTLTASDVNGCVNTTTSSVSLKPLPLISSKGSTVCLGNTASVSATTDGISLSWTGPNGFSSNQANNTFPNFSLIQVGDYTVIATAANQCTAMAIRNVTNYPVPTPTASNNGPVCLNGVVKFESSGGHVYNWMGPNGFISNSQNTTLLSANSMNYSGTYTLGVIDDKGCQGFTTTNLIVRALPTATINSGAISSCIPFCSVFSAVGSTSLQNIQWNTNNNNLAISTTYKSCFDTEGNYIINSKFTDVYGCSNSTSLSIQAYPIPKADFNFSPIEPIENDQVDFTDASQGDEINSWTWYFATNANIAFNQNPYHVFPVQGNYPVALVISNRWGCMDTIVKAIVIKEGFGIYVPNAFTPSNDGLNDFFQPKGYGIKKYNIMIFDRWGEKLFQTEDFYRGWDGTFKGKLCEYDTYVWKISVEGNDGKKRELAGIVTLVR